jgi:8-oxo-dGTP pyrophosphatase MutT (NUDIX family)
VRWIVHGERSVYDSHWVSVRLIDVEVPGGSRFEHHAVRLPRPAAGTVVQHADRGILLLWRHRFIPDSWGWEIPAGRLEPGETPEQAAARETLEETGWRPLGLSPLLSYHPASGLSDQTFHLFVAHDALEVGDPTDVSESERVEWVPVDRVADAIRGGEIVDGMSLVGLLHVLAFPALP